jgi:hypothetical protein
MVKTEVNGDLPSLRLEEGGGGQHSVVKNYFLPSTNNGMSSLPLVQRDERGEERW